MDKVELYHRADTGEWVAECGVHSGAGEDPASALASLAHVAKVGENAPTTFGADWHPES